MNRQRFHNVRRYRIPLLCDPRTHLPSLLCESGVLSNLHDRWSKPHCWDLNPQPWLLKGTSVFQPTGYPPSICHSSTSLIFSLLSFSFPFFSAPLRPLFSSIYLSPPRHHDLLLSAPLWYFHLRLTLPSFTLFLSFFYVHSFEAPSFVFPPHSQITFIHYVRLFTLCPPLTLFIDVFSLSWTFPPFPFISQPGGSCQH